jgi:hypothetical protein
MTTPTQPTTEITLGLGIPTELESYQHQCLMLLDELQEAWSDIRRLKADTHTLIAMNDGLKAELKALKLPATAQPMESDIALVGTLPRQQAR